MPYLPHDPSVFLDDDLAGDLAIALSETLRSSPALKPKLDRLVGNRWANFEAEAKRLIAAILLQQGGWHDSIDALVDDLPMFKSDDMPVIEEVFLRAVLTVLPMHAAAAVHEISERILTAVEGALRNPEAADKVHRVEALRHTLNSGALFR